MFNTYLCYLSSLNDKYHKAINTGTGIDTGTTVVNYCTFTE